MKKLLITLFWVGMAWNSYGQNSSWYYPYSVEPIESFDKLIDWRMSPNSNQQEMKKEWERIASQKLYEVKVYVSSNQNSKRLSTEYAFDKSGRIIKRKDWNKKNELISTKTWEFNDSNRVVLFNDQHVKKKHQTNIHNSFNEQGLFIEHKRSDKGGKKLKRWTSQFDENRKRTEYILYVKGTDEIASKSEYSYHQGGELAEKRYYVKGVLKKKWTYDCNPLGDEVKEDKVKDIGVCKDIKYDDLGNRVEITEVNEEGKIRKHISKYDAKDRKIGALSYSQKGKLIYESEHIYHDDSTLTYIYKNHRKNRVSIYETKYNADKNILMSKNYHKGKFSSMTTYKYDTDGLLIETNGYYNSEKEVSYSTKMEYNSGLNMVRKTKYYYKKNPKKNKKSLTQYEYVKG